MINKTELVFQKELGSASEQFWQGTSEMKNQERQPRRPESGRITYAGWQTVVPSSPLPSHALERAAAVQSVAQVTAERDGTASKVTLITDFKSKLWHPRIIAVRQLKTWQEEEGKKNRVKRWLYRKMTPCWTSRHFLFEIHPREVMLIFTVPVSTNKTWTFSIYILLGVKRFILEWENN